MAPTLKQLSDFLSSLDPKNDMEGHAFRLDTKNELGFTPNDPFDFFGATPYGTWKNANSNPPVVPKPNVVAASVAAALKNGLECKNFSTSQSGEKFVFVDILHLGEFNEKFFHADGPNGIFGTLCSSVNALPQDVTPVIRVLTGDWDIHRTQFQDSSGAPSWRHYSELFWPGGSQQFTHPKAKLHIGWYNPDFKKDPAAAPTTLPAWTTELINELHDFLKAEFPVVQGIDDLITQLREHSLKLIQFVDTNGVPSLSWNHAKVVAVNATTLTTGGANLWDVYGDDSHAAFDALIKVRGDAALQGHRYADALWDYLNAIPSKDDASMSFTRSLATKPPQSAGDFEVSQVPLVSGTSQSVSNNGGQSTLTVSNVGDKLPGGRRYPILALDALRDAILQMAWLEVTQNDKYKAYQGFYPMLIEKLSDVKLLPILQKHNISPMAWASKAARHHAVENAQNDIILCQQLLTQVFLAGKPLEQAVDKYLKDDLHLDWDGFVVPIELLSALGRGLANIVANHPDDKSKGISVLLSTSDAPGGNNNPSSWSGLKKILTNFVPLRDAEKIVDERVHCKRIMDNNKEFFNHTKIVCVDQSLLYVGSDNAYPQYNAQHGIWIEEQKNVKAWYEQYWTEAWAKGKEATD